MIITYMRNLKFDTNDSPYETETYQWTENRLVVGGGVGLGEGWSGRLGLADLS